MRRSHGSLEIERNGQRDIDRWRKRDREIERDRER